MAGITRKLPFTPLESEVNALIASCGPKTLRFCSCLETGVRAGEALGPSWDSVDLERRELILNQPEKNGNPSIFRISVKLIGMLSRLPKPIRGYSTR